MNVYVMVDIEGISGVYTKTQVGTEGGRYQEGRRYMTEDINACVAGLKAAGVEKVLVRDCHGGSTTLEWHNACSEADGYICGYEGDDRFPGLEECDAVILLGYHAMAGTAGAVLEHSYSSVSIQNMYINGVKVGEIAMDASMVGERGKKVIMVSGDDKACAEAKAFLPNVVTAQVKQGLSTQGAILLPPEKARKLIYEQAIAAVKNAENVEPFAFEKPICCKVELLERCVLPKPQGKPYMTVCDGRSFEVQANTTEEALFRVF